MGSANDLAPKVLGHFRLGVVEPSLGRSTVSVGSANCGVTEGGTHSCSSRIPVLPISERPEAPNSRLAISARLEGPCPIRSNTHILTLEEVAAMFIRACLSGLWSAVIPNPYSAISVAETPTTFELAGNDV